MTDSREGQRTAMTQYHAPRPVLRRHNVRATDGAPNECSGWSSPLRVLNWSLRFVHQTDMPVSDLFVEFQARVNQLLAQSPARDLEQNLRALMQQGFAKLDLATREQLDLQTELLARARQRLTELEGRVVALEEAALLTNSKPGL